MTLKSPCVTCERVGELEDKNNSICLNCVERLNYVKVIESGNISDLKLFTVPKQSEQFTKVEYPIKVEVKEDIKKCLTEGCLSPAKSSGYCLKCYGRRKWRERHGKSLEDPIQSRGTSIRGKYDEAKNQGLTLKELTKSKRESQKDKEKATKIVTLDLSSHPELWDTLVKHSNEELRTIENQVIWNLKNSIGNRVITSLVP